MMSLICQLMVFVKDFVNHNQFQEVEEMNINRILTPLAVVVTSTFIISVSGCASSSKEIIQPPQTSHMKATVGTPDELSPLAPPEARNVRKVGNQWQCEVGGKTMIYDNAKACWEPQKK
jgi:hypothetical protein